MSKKKKKLSIEEILASIPRYTNLNNHTEYTMLKGYGSLKNNAKASIQKGLYGLALTDLPTMQGNLDLYENIDLKLAKSFGFEGDEYPTVMGAELYITDCPYVKDPINEAKRITVYVKNQIGFKNLSYLISISGYPEKVYDNLLEKNIPRISPKDLFEKKEGLIVTSGMYNGYIPQAIAFEGYKVRELLIELFKDPKVLKKFNKNIKKRKFQKEDFKDFDFDIVQKIRENDILRSALQKIETEDMVIAKKFLASQTFPVEEDIVNFIMDYDSPSLIQQRIDTADIKGAKRKKIEWVGLSLEEKHVLIKFMSEHSPERLLKRFKAEFKEDFYLELNLIDRTMAWDYEINDHDDIGWNPQDKINQELIRLSKKHKVKAILTQENMIPYKEDHLEQSIMLFNADWNKKKDWHYYDEQYIMSVEEMYEIVQKKYSWMEDEDFIEICNNTQFIVEDCKDCKLEFKPSLPSLDYDSHYVNKVPTVIQRSLILDLQEAGVWTEALKERIIKNKSIGSEMTIPEPLKLKYNQENLVIDKEEMEERRKENIFLENTLKEMEKKFKKEDPDFHKLLIKAKNDIELSTSLKVMMRNKKLLPYKIKESGLIPGFLEDMKYYEDNFFKVLDNYLWSNQSLFYSLFVTYDELVDPIALGEFLDKQSYTLSEYMNNELSNIEEKLNQVDEEGNSLANPLLDMFKKATSGGFVDELQEEKYKSKFLDILKLLRFNDLYDEDTFEEFLDDLKSKFEKNKNLVEDLRSKIEKHELATTMENYGLKIIIDEPTLLLGNDEVRARLVEEINTIQYNGKLKLITYFMLLEDVSNFHKENNYLYGLGRGSGAGCMFAHGLDITNCDPLYYGLLFERFLTKERIGAFYFEYKGYAKKDLVNNIDENCYETIEKSIKLAGLSDKEKERAEEELWYLWCNREDTQYIVELKKALKGKKIDNTQNSMIAFLYGICKDKPSKPILQDPTTLPDIDYDTMVRNEVKNYLVYHFGTDYVTLMGTFGVLKTKGVVKDIMKQVREEITFGEVNVFTKRFEVIDEIAYGKKYLDYFHDCLNEEPYLNEWFSTNKDVKNHVERMMGALKTLGKHAGGIVVAGDRVYDILSCRFDQDEKILTTENDMDFVEYAGLIKYDFLGLKTLEDISRAFRLIEKRHGKRLSYYNINLHDPRIFKKFRDGDAMTIFQFNKAWQRKYIRNLNRIRSIEDLATITSILRPGPMEMGMHEEFIHLVNGTKPITYLHHSLEDILKETYGVTCYQEQVMAIVRELGGLSGNDSVTVLKAMGKKKLEKLIKFKKIFMDSAREKFPKDMNKIVEHYVTNFANKYITLTFDKEGNPLGDTEKRLKDDVRLGLDQIKDIFDDSIYTGCINEDNLIKKLSENNLIKNAPYISPTNSLFLIHFAKSFSSQINYLYDENDISIFKEVLFSYLDKSEETMLGVNDSEEEREFYNELRLEDEEKLESLYQIIMFISKSNVDVTLPFVKVKEDEETYTFSHKAVTVTEDAEKTYHFYIRKDENGYEVFFNQINVVLSEKIWLFLEAFAKYGFNKSHAVAYSTISYLCMWLKHYYPIEWITACMSGANKDDFKEFYMEWHDHIINPDINRSGPDYMIVKESNGEEKAMTPASFINGVGEAAVSHIVETQPNKSFSDFYNKVDKSKVNKKAILSMIETGCFDTLQPSYTINFKKAGFDKERIDKEIVDIFINEFLKTYAEADLEVVTKDAWACINIRFDKDVSQEDFKKVIVPIFKAMKLERKEIILQKLTKEQFRKQSVFNFFNLRYQDKKPTKDQFIKDKIDMDRVKNSDKAAMLLRQISLLNLTYFDFAGYFKQDIESKGIEAISVGDLKKKISDELERLEPSDKPESESFWVLGAVNSVRIEEVTNEKSKDFGKEKARITIVNKGDFIRFTMNPTLLEFNDKDDKEINQIRKWNLEDNFVPMIVKVSSAFFKDSETKQWRAYYKIDSAGGESTFFPLINLDLIKEDLLE